MNRLLARLEPLAEEDGGTEAIFVALQLTTMPCDISPSFLSQQRAALLYSWIFSHNSNASRERLEFWCRYDIEAYAQFVAAFFERLYSGNSQDFVVAPMARLWKEGGTQAIVLASHLREWLLLVWFTGCGRDRLSHQGHQLPIAKTADQVRLSSLAVSLLSLRPERAFLSDLALSIATDELTWRQAQDQRCHFKCISENIGILMRWHYTEHVLAELEQLALRSATDELMINGLRRLTRLLLTVEVPTALRLPPYQRPNLYFGTPAIELLRNRHRVFESPRTELFPNEHDFSHLAVRDDLPPLSESDTNAVRAAVATISEKNSLHASTSRSFEDLQMEALWPWFARFFPVDLLNSSADYN